MAPAFGPESAGRHRGAALAAGLTLHELRLPSLNRDVDTIDDLEAVWDDVGKATFAVLGQFQGVLPRPGR
jgi:2-phospho-L-lactate guanylyltransferase (CobY/MobA/RfbA family)